MMSRMNQAMHDLFKYNNAILPQKRSSFDKSHSHTTTMDSAFLVPLMWDRVLPGDEKKIRYSGLARMATPIHPVMDDAFLDVWAFYVPDRLWWNHAKEFYGENLDASFNADGEYTMPSLTPTQYMVNPSADALTTGFGSLNDYFGFPIWDVNRSQYPTESRFDCTAGLHRSYQLIWNDWFRNSSVQRAIRFNNGDTVSDEEWREIQEIRKVCKLPDYFTSMLRQPQSGESVSLPLGDWAPVVTRSNSVNLSDYRLPGDGQPFGTLVYNQYDSDGYPVYQSDYELYSNNLTSYGSQLRVNKDENVYNSSGDWQNVYIGNLWANLTNATSATINNLRNAITIQQLLEISNLGGKRYQNIIQAHFGVLTPDATVQRPELLGCTRTYIGMRQVLQTSATQSDSPQGNTAAFSLTSIDNEWICNKAFTEPGFIMVLGAIRPIHSYSQGLDPLLRKLDLYDHYFPVFDNLGNQPIDNATIYFTNTGIDPYEPDGVFGYQEAWTEYRVRSNRVSGLMRPDAPGSLASWNYSTLLDQSPSLSNSFVSEDPNLIDRTIAVQDEPQFYIDSYFNYIDVKNMSVHSIPGLTRL